MKYYHWLSIAVLAFATRAHAFQSKIEIVEQFDTFRLVAFIVEQDIQNSPKWNPNADAPPLSVAEAILAVKTFKKSSKNLEAVKEIEIRPVPKHKEYWHYLIKVANDKMKTKYDIYVVLMSGKVIPAIIEPQSVK